MASAIPGVGAIAPDFSLDSTSGAKVSLADFRGKQPVLLAFFPLAFTSTCTAELCAMTDEWSAFADSGAAIIPISVDAVPSLKEYKAKYGMKVDLASDFRREVCRAYGTFNPERFYSNRAYILVDTGGIIRWRHDEERNGDRRENSEILAAIAAL
jgi:peroxiredoxin